MGLNLMVKGDVQKTNIQKANRDSIAVKTAELPRIRSMNFMGLFANDFMAMSDEVGITLMVCQIVHGTTIKGKVEQGTNTSVYEHLSITIPWRSAKVLSDLLLDVVHNYEDSAKNQLSIQDRLQATCEAYRNIFNTLLDNIEKLRPLIPPDQEEKLRSDLEHIRKMNTESR